MTSELYGIPEELNPLGESHRQRMEEGKAALGRAGILLGALERCGVDCQANRQRHSRYSEFFESVEREFFPPQIL